eukprot:scaffold115109_cov18-Phaeocystis_antarctica.AAC.1
MRISLLSPLISPHQVLISPPSPLTSPALTRSRRDLVRRRGAGAVRQHPLPGAQTSALTPTLTPTPTRYQAHRRVP